MAYDGVTHDLYYDLLATTQQKEKWNGDFVTLRSRHNYPLLNMFFRGPKKEMIKGGDKLAWNVQYRENGQAQMTRSAAVRERQIVATQTVASLAWVKAFGSYTITKDEMDENWGDTKIVDLTKSKRIAGLMDLANKIEPQLWGCPASATDDLNANGITYWLPPITGAQVTAGTVAGAHQGTVSATIGTDVCANINASTYSRWQSYNAGWSNSSGEITEEDLRRMGRAWRRTHFKNPIGLNGGIDESMQVKMFLGACETVVDSFSASARRNNDETGADPSKYYGAGITADGSPVFKGSPVVWCEDLDNNSEYGSAAGYPMVGLNLSEWKPFVYRNCDFVEELRPVFRDQPDVYVTDIDVKFNISVWNRQTCGFVISYVAAA